MDSSDASFDDIKLQVGANDNEDLTVEYKTQKVSIDTTAAAGIGTGSIALESIDVKAATPVGTIEQVDDIIKNVSTMRSYLGAVQNSLESRMEYLDVAVENNSASRSRVKDVDVAKESSTMLKNQILQQSAAAMLSQANATPQLALNLLP